MACFQLHLCAGVAPLVVESDVASLEELGRDLVRNRFMTVRLLEEAGVVLDERRDLLVPLHQVKLISAAP